MSKYEEKRRALQDSLACAGDGELARMLDALAAKVDAHSAMMDMTSLYVVREAAKRLRGGAEEVAPVVVLHDAPIVTGPCTCECNHGGFCGGCGHAGCGLRRR